ncbi:hypothetical protein PMO31116_00518 [Pandoraea morbifera]|uniref:N-acetyltransferase domain-containing protein n=1 Tax=Pandoraea morbifera TaxID=2508300 RepID=A0A5E4S427_9BURK|nr:hypothetical protein [Pandoraea morbifera]VVD69334.1 hypothetical protein PMO31116_00518 [Pandoraea morbifera]
MPTFQSVDRTGNPHDFDYKTIHNGNNVTFRVTANPPLASGAFFDLEVEHLTVSLVRIVMINSYLEPAYIRKGVADALLPIVSRDLGVTVQSSPTLGTGGVYRTPHATAMWQRLVAKGMATYDPQTDIFTLN